LSAAVSAWVALAFAKLVWTPSTAATVPALTPLEYSSAAAAAVEALLATTCNAAPSAIKTPKAAPVNIAFSEALRPMIAFARMALALV